MSEAPTVNDGADLTGELGFPQFLFGIVKAQIRKHVAAGHFAGDSSVMTLLLPIVFAIVRLSHLQSL